MNPRDIMCALTYEFLPPKQKKTKAKEEISKGFLYPSYARCKECTSKKDCSSCAYHKRKAEYYSNPENELCLRF